MEENAKAPDTPEHSIDRSPSPSPSPLMATPTRTLTKLQTPPPTPPLSDEKETSGSPLHILFLGSSLGNFDRDGATAFLKSLPLRPGSSCPSLSFLFALTHSHPPIHLYRNRNRNRIYNPNFHPPVRIAIALKPSQDQETPSS
jgi:hypothetical protein